MAVVNGLGGSVTFSGIGITSNVKEWSISFAGAELDTTAMNDGTTGNWDTYIAGRLSWSGSWTSLWDSEGTAFEPTDGTVPIVTGIGDTAEGATFVFCNDTTDGKIAGDIIVTGVDTTVNIDGANEISYTFRGTSSPQFHISAS
jgi:hypothetical protein